jgi:hypothetical protein
VLQPNTLIEMEGPLGLAVHVGESVNTAVSLGFGALVLVIDSVLVTVAIAGVELLTAMTTGVGVWTGGVGVGGKKGVGPGMGSKTQPLQDDSRNANRLRRIGVFIFFSSAIIVSRFPVPRKVPINKESH